MTIDEAIELQMKIAGKGSDCWKNCRNTKKHCKDCMAEHEQIAEWLEELKELRKIKEDYAKGMQTSYATFMYNKAIDDFVESISLPLSDEDICKIVEQLKAGESDEE